MVRRRDFLKLTACGAGAAIVLGGRRVEGAPFGSFPDSAKHALLPEGLRAKNVLEVFLYGGLSQWETFYMVEEYGRPTDPMYANTQYYAFGGTGSDSVSRALQRCAFPTEEPEGVPFATDELGAQVRLGPFAYLLRSRPDVTDRMRVLVQRHDLEPHEAAIPLALTGRRVGSPKMAGLGAHIQRYFNERTTTTRKSPYAYVFSTGGLPGDNVLSATATGAHPGSARPLRIKVDNADALTELLSRPGAGDADNRARIDRALSVYTSQYRSRLRWKNQGEPFRSPRVADLAQAVTNVSNVDGVKAVLDPSLFESTPNTVCGDSNFIDIPATSFRLAAHLLTHPGEPARYVNVVDTGLIEASGGGGYDTHTDNSRDTARNFKNLLSHLLSIINEPGENDPGKIDLDETLVILNTEFGRTPWRQDGGSGRNHHPWGYCTVMFGGPIGTGQKGIVGAIGPDGNARNYVTPGENRIAALLALGIWPFSQESYFVSDVQGVPDEESGAEDVVQRVLGVSL